MLVLNYHHCEELERTILTIPIFRLSTLKHLFGTRKCAKFPVFSSFNGQKMIGNFNQISNQTPTAWEVKMFPFNSL